MGGAEDSVEPRLDVAASFTACHEAGHAVARYLVHGTTGAICPEPQPDKEAGTESQPLPDDLVASDPAKPGEEKLVDGPYDPEQQARLEQEIKTTLAGSAAEGIMRGKRALDVLEEAPQTSDWEKVWGIAKRLWPHSADRESEVARLAHEISREIDDSWEKVRAVAEAYDTRGCLTADEVTELMVRDEL